MKSKLPGGFLPAPVPFSTEPGACNERLAKATGNCEFGSLLEQVTYALINKLDTKCYDRACPSLNDNDLSDRSCKSCSKYHPSAKARKAHEKMCAQQTQMLDNNLQLEVDEPLVDYFVEPDDAPMPILQFEDSLDFNNV